MSWRLRSVRKRILILALVPVLSLLGLYVFTTTITARNAIVLARTQTLKNGAGQSTGRFDTALQVERLGAVLYLSAPTPANRAALGAMAQKTSRGAAGLRAALLSSVTMGSADAPEKQAIATLLAEERRPAGAAQQLLYVRAEGRRGDARRLLLHEGSGRPVG